MGLPRPPQHRVDAKPVFVHRKDEAWDLPKIEAEKLAMEERQKGSSYDHEFERYHRAETRYDIAPVLQYLDTDKAWQYELRPLDRGKFYEVKDVVERFGEWRGYDRAAEYCFVRSSGHGAPETLEDAFREDPNLPAAIGNAGYLASLPLSESEKKGA